MGGEAGWEADGGVTAEERLNCDSRFSLDSG